MAAGQCMPECSQLGRNDWPKWVGNRLRCFGRWSNMPGEERQSLAPTKLNMKPGSFHKWSLVCPWVDIWSEWSRMSCWDFLLKWPSSHLQTSWPRLWLSGGDNVPKQSWQRSHRERCQDSWGPTAHSQPPRDSPRLGRSKPRKHHPDRIAECPATSAQLLVPSSA